MDAQSSLFYEDETYNCDYRIMIIGITGSGKSTACNFVLGRKAFAARRGAVSITGRSDAHSGNVLNSKVLFIDTPGFSDAYETNEQRMQDLATALYFAQNGVHAIGICYDGSKRYDVSADEAVSHLSVLGTFWPHAFILYTHADDMGDTEQERKEEVMQWLSEKRCPPGLKILLEQVNNRYITLESKSKDVAYHGRKCKELLGLVDQILKNNNGHLYDNQLFKIVKENYDKLVQEKEKQKEDLEKIQKSLDDYKEKYDNLVEMSIRSQSNELELQKRAIEIETLKEEKSKLQKKYDVPVRQQCIQKTTLDLAKYNFADFCNDIMHVTVYMGTKAISAARYVQGSKFVVSNCSIM